MSIIYRYVHVPRPDGTLRKAPHIPVYARDSKNKLIEIIALVDSGADTTVIPKDLALLLGLKESKADMKTGGIGGSTRVKETKLSFTVKNERERYNLRVPALVLQNPDEDVPLILGRNGFFEEFHITFKQSDEKLVLKKVDPKN
jgi:hypothetical protein